jgi:uncharacterized protein (DUF885 family)
MNPINYARGLLVTFEDAQRSGVKALEAEAREFLTWVSGELEKVDARALSDDASGLYDDVKQAVADALASKPKRVAKAPAPTE